MSDTGHTVRLELPSIFEMIDLAEAVSDSLARVVGFDEEAQHWVSVAVRESVVNAIKHGNHFDPAKLVFIEFTARPASRPTELAIVVKDEGEGFDPEVAARPAGPREPAEGQRPGYLLHAQLHGRRADPARAPGAGWKSTW